MSENVSRPLATWWAIHQFFSCWWMMAFDRSFRRVRPGYCYCVAPWYVRVCEALWVGPLFAFGQSWAHFVLDPWRLSWKPFEWADWLEHRVALWCDKHTTWYAWMPPDSGDPQEVGFHLRADLARSTKDGERMRIYNRTPESWAT